MSRHMFRVLYHTLVDGENQIGYADFPYEKYREANKLATEMNKANVGFGAEVITLKKCDTCDEWRDVADIRPHVTERPSDPTALCTILIGCNVCNPSGHDYNYWAEYIESDEALAAGHMWLEL